MNDFELKYKEILFKTFKYLIDYLESNNYKWFAGYGTCLGAVRHKGIIPWDDDIDILMPRNDYNRFLNSYKDNKDYYTISFDKDPNYPFAFAKFCDGNTTILETNGINITFGIYIDIFPLDFFAEPYDNILYHKLKYDKLYRLFERSQNSYYFDYVFKMLKGFRVLNCIAIAKDIVYFKHKKEEYYKELKVIESKSTDNHTDYIVALPSVYKGKDIFKSEWFDESIIVPFEDFSVRIPKNYEVYLKHVYGDYMTPPPIEKQVTKHSHVYDNLGMRLSVSESRKRVIMGINIEY